MPVILDNGSEEIRTWLDPKRSTWSKELQSLLRPYQGELEVYPVSNQVGKVGNNSPNFIIPIASTENKSNIANFFGKQAAKSEPKAEKRNEDPKPEEIPEKQDEVKSEEDVKQEQDNERTTVDHDGSEDHAPLPIPKEETKRGIKRELDDAPNDEPPKKIINSSASPSKESSKKPARKTRSATSNNTASPSKSRGKEKGSQKITSFFSK